MSDNSVRVIKTDKYKIYENGYVYTHNNQLKLILLDDEFEYVFHNKWIKKVDKERLTELIDNHPESFDFLRKTILPEGLAEKIRESLSEIYIPTEDKTLEQRLEIIASKKQIQNYKTVRDTTFAEALIVLLNKKPN